MISNMFLTRPLMALGLIVPAFALPANTVATVTSEAGNVWAQTTMPARPSQSDASQASQSSHWFNWILPTVPGPAPQYDTSHLFLFSLSPNYFFASDGVFIKTIHTDA